MPEEITEENSVIIRRSAKYGEQVRLAEDANDKHARLSARRAWVALLNSLRGTPLEGPARTAYWDALCSNGESRE